MPQGVDLDDLKWASIYVVEQLIVRIDSALWMEQEIMEAIEALKQNDPAMKPFAEGLRDESHMRGRQLAQLRRHILAVRPTAARFSWDRNAAKETFPIQEGH